MAKIFLSYRRDDSAAAAERIYDHLHAHFGPDAVFRDIDNIRFGVDFREHIDAALVLRPWTRSAGLAPAAAGWAPPHGSAVPPAGPTRPGSARPLPT